MKKPLLALLLFHGITAVAGGIALIAGWTNLPVWDLRTANIENFFWPGVILIFIVGGSALDAAISFLRHKDYAPVLALLSGIIMEGWILAEMFIVVQFSWLQVLYLFTGIAVIILAAECMIKQLGQNAPHDRGFK